MILASASPRRREICTQIGISFTVDPALTEEPLNIALPLEEAVTAVARAKAEEVSRRHPGEWVLGADTVVCCDNTVFGKPKDEQDAFSMLSRLSDNAHRVITGVWLCRDGEGSGFADTARVIFMPMTDAEICEYIATGEPMDKAGAYGIQGLGARYIREIHGDFYTVMGLPAAATYRLLTSHL